MPGVDPSANVVPTGEIGDGMSAGGAGNSADNVRDDISLGTSGKRRLRPG